MNPTEVAVNAANILNYIRQDASTYYKNYVPKASVDADNLKVIGNIIMGDATLRNEFVSALVNRIGFVTITSKEWDNPWSFFDKGMVEFGQTTEEIFVNIAKPFEYDAEVGVDRQYKRQIPDVRSAFHVMNWQKFFKVTIQEKDLKMAFLAWGGMQDLIGKIIGSMSTGLNYAVYNTMKYLIARVILQGQGNAQEIPQVSVANMKTIISKVKEISNNWTILNNKNNLAGVMNHTPKSEQYLILTNAFDAMMDVEVLASAFNMDKTEFYGHRVLIDGFGEIDDDYMEELFTKADGTVDPCYIPLTAAEKTALNTIPAILVDGSFMQIYTNMHEMTEKFNGESIYWNYWLHEWRTFSVSPFSQRMTFVPATPAVTGVTLSPSTATIFSGQKVQLTPTVTATGFANKAVVYESSDPTVATVDATGLVTAIKAGSVTITATSVADDSVSGTATITVSSGISSVSVSPQTKTIAEGGTAQLTATVVSNGMVSEAVAWTSADETKASVDQTGLVTTKTGFTSGTVRITATSVIDSSKSAYCTVTGTSA